MSERSDDPLEQLRARIERTREAAERLADEARREAAGSTFREPARDPYGDRPRPAWAPPPPPGDGDGDVRRGDPELQALGSVYDAVRGLVGPELRAQVADLVRELLLALRALIDWCLERLEARRTAPVDVQDIPID